MNLDSGEQDVLRHLLDVEAQAASLVDEAQAEADRRVSESEKGNRARYDERYGLLAAKLNGEYEAAVLAVKADYARQLDAYSSSLAAMPVQRAAFSTLAERLFFGDH
jgi:F0F1-type ATP synthase membrane subunit b/b'